MNRVSGRLSSPDDLTALLERLGLERPPAPGVERAAEGIDRLLARAALLTEALRGSTSNDTTRLASRMLLDDLSAVAAQFRSAANAIHLSLSNAQRDLEAAIDAAGPPRPPSRPA
jgi:hypothetical protein